MNAKIIKRSVKEKVLHTVACVITICCFIYAYGVAGSCELDVLTIGQAVTRLVYTLITLGVAAVFEYVSRRNVIEISFTDYLK